MSIDIAKKRVLESTPLVDLIGERLELKRRAGRHVGLCPFHEEKTPSFTIFDDHYFCFGCRARGDAIDFVRQDQGLGFIEALKYLAEKFRIEVPELEQGIKDQAEHQKISRYYQLLQASRDYFCQQLQDTDAGRNCQHYLQQRGYDTAAITDLDFGYAPDRPTGLVAHLLKKGFALQDMIAVSVATQSERDRRTYDFYRHRLMIPIRDHYGRIIGFGGRTMGDDPAKYKNSRETVLFDKSRVLYGFDQAKESVRKKRRAIVVEGYMDALQLRHQGFTETVACLGTALTIHHAKRVSQLAQTIYLVFDGDTAGQRASLKTVELAMDLPNVQFHVLALPEGEDPDSFVRRYGAEAFEDQLAAASDLLSYAIATKLQGAHDTAIPELINREFIPWLRSVRDPIQQSYLAAQIAKQTQIPRDEILGLIRRSPKENRQGARNQPEPPAAAPAPVTPLQPLKKHKYDAMGHLFFATPDELDVDRVQVIVEQELKMDGLWLDLIREFLAYMSRNNAAPANYDIGAWQAASSQLVLETLEELRHRKQGAFECNDRMPRLERLARLQQREDLERSRGSLKKSLHQAPPEDQIDILKTINQINQDITQIEGELKSLFG
jgi:DNA primase